MKTAAAGMDPQRLLIPGLSTGNHDVFQRLLLPHVEIENMIQEYRMGGFRETISPKNRLKTVRSEVQINPEKSLLVCEWCLSAPKRIFSFPPWYQTFR